MSGDIFSVTMGVMGWWCNYYLVGESRNIAKHSTMPLGEKKKILQQRIFWPKRSLRAEVENPCAWHFLVLAAVSILFSAGLLVPGV